MPQGIYENIKCKGKVNSDVFKPQKHQISTLKYFLKSPYKGLLLYHRLGSGKTCTSILIADKLIREKKIEKIYILTPGSLRKGWIDEYCGVCGNSGKTLRKYYIFMTYNYAIGKKANFEKNSLIIIDEVHNLIRGVVNNSPNPKLIYEKIIDSNAKILALSGTPVFNDFREFAILGSLLNPKLFPPIKFITDERDIEVPDYSEFEKHFKLKDDNLYPKNQADIDKLFNGIISYFPGVSKELYPTIIYEKPVFVKMSPLQTNHYFTIANIENKIRGRGVPSKKDILKNPKKYKRDFELFMMASKYILSRGVSNIYRKNDIGYIRLKDEEENKKCNDCGKLFKKHKIPCYDKDCDYEKAERKFKKRLRKYKDNKDKIEKLNECGKLILEKKCFKDNTENLEDMNDIIPFLEAGGKIKRKVKPFSEEELEKGNLQEISMKFITIILNIAKYPEQKHVIFSFFKERFGILLLKQLFDKCKIKTAIFTGDLTDAERSRVLKVFNSKKNRHGEKIQVLLITEAGAEGISIREARHLHILESSPREKLIQQVIGRIARYKSHVDMSKNERNVHIWRYISVPDGENREFITHYGYGKNKKTMKVKIDPDKPTIDMTLYKKGQKSIHILNKFNEILLKHSVN